MERIWEEERRAGSNRLRLATLERLGGAESIVRAHLRRAVEDLSSAEKDVAADVFRYLVTPSGTKIAHGLGDLAEYTSVDEQRLLPVLTTLRRERIVRPVDGAAGNGDRYEIYHDVLADAVLGWRRERELERERRAASRRQRRLAGLSGGALLALAAMTAVAIYAFSQRSEAQEQRSDAQARALLAESLNQLDVDPELSLLLGLEAAAFERTRQVEDVLRRALDRSRLLEVRETSDPPVPKVPPSALSPNGRLSARGGTGTDYTARLLSTKTGRVLDVLRGHTLPVTAIAFSPDGKLLVTGSRDGTGRIWTVANRELFATLVGHTNPITSVSFNPRSDLVATGSSDRTARIWGATSTAVGKHFVTLKGLREGVTRVHFLDDGRLETVSSDGSVRVWDPEPEPRLRVVGRAPKPRPGPLTSAADDKRAVVEESLVVVRDGSGNETRLIGHSAPVTSVHFDQAGRRLVTTSADSDARIWDAETGQLLHTLRGHFGTVNDAGFSPDGRWVVTAGPISGGLWRSDANEPYAYLRNAGFPLDARFEGVWRVVVVDRDGLIRAWVCDICGTLDDLVRLAEAQLARTGRTLTIEERRRFLGESPDRAS